MQNSKDKKINPFLKIRINFHKIINSKLFLHAKPVVLGYTNIVYKFVSSRQQLVSSNQTRFLKIQIRFLKIAIRSFKPNPCTQDINQLPQDIATLSFLDILKCKPAQELDRSETNNPRLHHNEKAIPQFHSTKLELIFQQVFTTFDHQNSFELHSLLYVSTLHLAE